VWNGEQRYLTMIRLRAAQLLACPVTQSLLLTFTASYRNNNWFSILVNQSLFTQISGMPLEHIGLKI